MPHYSPETLSQLGHLPLIAQRVIEGMSQVGLHAANALGQGLEFSQYRPYYSGDDLRQLDWHLYARSDELACRVQNPDTAMRVGFFMDASASMHYHSSGSAVSKWRYASMCAAVIAALAVRQGDEIGLFAYNSELLPADNLHLSLEAFCSRLEAITPSGASRPRAASLAMCDWLKHRGIAICLSDFIDQSTECTALFRSFQTAGCGCIALQVLTDDELNLPFESPSHFIDPESNDDIVTAPELVREEYLRRLQQFLAAIRNAALSCSVSFQQVSTSAPIAPVIMQALQYRTDNNRISEPGIASN